MTTVATRVRRISDLEGFDIIVMEGGKPVDVKQNGVLSEYPYKKMSRGNWTVARFKEKFEKAYDGFSCAVLLENGEEARGNRTLNSVRESYEEEDE